MRESTWILASVLAGAIVTAAPVRAQQAEAASEVALSDDAELARIVSLVEAAKYEECVARLDRLLDPKGSRPLKNPDVIETARIYHATCFIGLGKPELADVPLRNAIRANPQMRAPDSLVFPPRVVERFLRVREGLYLELQAAEQAAIANARKEAAEKQKRENDERARMQALEQLARQETIIVENRRWIAVLPFGAGQFQNGNRGLGWAFLGTELVLGAAALTALGVHTHLQANGAEVINRGNSVSPSENDRAKNWFLALKLTTYGLIGTHVLGVAEAQLSFVPHVRKVRTRPLPKLPGDKQALKLVPDVAIGSDAVSLGVRGSF
jgi:hypothetical protein